MSIHADHLETCKVVTLRQMAKALGETLPPELEAGADDHGVMDCDDDCPSRTASIEHGRELALRFGW